MRRPAGMCFVVALGIGCVPVEQATTEPTSRDPFLFEPDPLEATDVLQSSDPQDPFADADGDGVPAHQDCDEWTVTRYGASSNDILNRSEIWSTGNQDAAYEVRLDTATLSLCPGNYFVRVSVFEQAEVILRARNHQPGDPPAVTLSPIEGTAVVVPMSAGLSLEGIRLRLATGGALRVEQGGWAHLRDAEVVRNRAHTGAGIWNESDGAGDRPGVLVEDSLIAENTASTDGGGVANFGTMVIERSTVGDTRGAIGNGAIVGGGIWNSGSLEIRDSRVGGNDASFEGGGLFSLGKVELTDVVVEDNRAVTGAGLHVTESVATLERVRLARNVAEQGAGLYAINSTVSIDDSEVEINRASLDGAGLAVVDDAQVVVAGGTLTGNDAGRRGGGVALLDSTSQTGGGAVELTEVLVDGNTADQGGGIAVHLIEGRGVGAPTVELQEVQFTGNSAQFGGAMQVFSTAWLPATIVCTSEAPEPTFVVNEAFVAGGGILFAAGAEARWEATGCRFGSDAEANVRGDVEFFQGREFEIPVSGDVVCTGGMVPACG